VAVSVDKLVRGTKRIRETGLRDWMAFPQEDNEAMRLAWSAPERWENRRGLPDQRRNALSVYDTARGGQRRIVRYGEASADTGFDDAETAGVFTSTPRARMEFEAACWNSDRCSGGSAGGPGAALIDLTPCAENSGRVADSNAGRVRSS